MLITSKKPNIVVEVAIITSVRILTMSCKKCRKRLYMKKKMICNPLSSMAPKTKNTMQKVQANKTSEELLLTELQVSKKDIRTSSHMRTKLLSSPKTSAKTIKLGQIKLDLWFILE